MEKPGCTTNLFIKDITNYQHTLPLFNKTSSTEPPPTAPPPSSLSPANDSSLLVRILCFFALFPLLFSIHTFVLSPLAQSLGHALLKLGGQSSTVVTGGELLKSYGKRELQKGSAEFGVFAALIPILVILSGIFAGLTLGYMSLDMTQLTILSTSGNPTQQAYAKKIMPVRKNGHQLLTTLLLVNMIVNETLPVIADPVLGGGVQAVVVSTVLIIIFAEIIPQSICSRYGLLVGAKAARMTQILIYVAYPVAKPVSLLLEKILGSHNGIIYRKAELRELLNLHAIAGMHGGDLLNGTVTMAQGALDLQDKSVFAHMTPIESVFMLEDTTKLDYEVLSRVVQSGHSRIPVYHTVEIPDLTGVGKTRKIKKILGTMLVKNCVLLDPEDATPIMSIPMSTLLTTVPQDQPLLDMLNAFREGRSHMALVSRRKRTPNPDQPPDIDEQSIIETAAGGLRERIRKKLAGSDTSDSSDDDGDLETGEHQSKKMEKKRSKRDLKKEKRQLEREKAEAERLETKKEGQGVPGDAFLEPKTVDKLMGDIEGETIGIITLEDVLEELIGNEIEDEYDQHDDLGHAINAFVPEEARAFVAKATQDRARQQLASDKARAQTTPLPSTVATADKAKSQATEASKAKTVAGAFVSKLGAGMGIRRTSSAPGKKRADVPEAAFPATGAATPTEAIGEGDEKLVLTTTVTESEKTEVGSDEEKKDVVVAMGAQEVLITTASSTPLGGSHVALPPATASAPTLPLPTSTPTGTINALPPPAMLAEALERGRKRGPPGALLVPSNATPGAGVGVGGRIPSVPVSGASTPVGAGSGGPVKKKTFKSTPTTSGVPGGPLKTSKTFSGSPLMMTEEPKKL